MTKDIRLWLALMLGTPAALIAVALAIAPNNKIAASITGLVLGLVVGIFVAVMVQEQTRAESVRANARVIQEGLEDKIKENKAETVDIALLNMRKLDEYYSLNKQQASRSFNTSIVAICVGFATIVLSVLYVRDPSTKFVSGLSGVFGQFIGACFFYLHNKSLNQLNLFYGKLISLQNTMLALQVCEKLHKNKEETLTLIALELMHRGEVAVSKSETIAGQKAKLQSRSGGIKSKASNVDKTNAMEGINAA